MKKTLRLFALVLAVMLIPTVAFAASPWTTETTYGGKLTEKLAFGFKNVMGGWTAIFSVPAKYHDEKKNMIVGIGEGLYKGVVYTIGGVLHLATFPIPVDIPLPDNGVSFE